MAFSPASAPPENFSSNTGAAPRPCRLRPMPAEREKNRPVASAVGLSERAPLFVELSQIILHMLKFLSPRVARRVVTGPIFQGADVGGCSFLCFVSFLSGQEGNEDSNAARSYRMNHRKMKLPRQRSVWSAPKGAKRKAARMRSPVLDERQRRLRAEGPLRLRRMKSVGLCLLRQLPAHAVCARCPRSGRKIGRWRQRSACLSGRRSLWDIRKSL